MIFAKYEPSSYTKRDPSNQRFSDKKFKYAWFTRDTHDDEENVQQHDPMDFKDIFTKK